MTIRMRLILSYIAMVIIPVLLVSLIGGLLMSLLFGDGQRFADRGERQTAVWGMMEERSRLMAGVTMVAQYDPALLDDERFVRETDEAFNRLGAGLVLEKNGTLAYVSPLVDDRNVAARLAQAERNSDLSDHRPGGVTDERFDYALADGGAGTLYLLIERNSAYPRPAVIFPLLLLTLLIVIGLTNGLLTFFVSRSILKPLEALRRAAEHIKEGDLDQPVRLGRKDEFGKLGEAFEEMRARLKQSLLQQLQVEENRKELIANISHDLKTPITGMRACVEAIRHGVADTEEKRDKYMRMIDRKTADLDRMIDELFLFSKLDLHRVPFQRERTDLAAYMSDCAHELQHDPRFRDVRIVMRSESGGPLYALVDRDKLRRAIMNVIDNSLRHMDKAEKRIEIGLTAAADGETATIRLQDNGPGIAPAALPHVFERFYRAEQARSAEKGGSGLGLAIVKHIIEEHNGSVRAESELGEGTAILFTLPLDSNRPTGGDGNEENINY